MSSLAVSRIRRNSSTRLNLYATSDLSDVTITCNGREFRAHSFVLAEASVFFRTMLSSNFKEGQTGHNLILDTVSCDLMEKVLPYLYGADLELTGDNLLDILELADMWMLDDLKKTCEEEFPKIVTQENSLKMREIAISFRCPYDVINLCEKRFFARLDRCLHSDVEFLQISHELLRRYFVEYQCATKDEIDVILAIHRWWRFDAENRMEHLEELLSSCVRHDDVDQDSLLRHLAFVKSYVKENDPFISCLSSLQSRDTPKKFPPARCAGEESPDGLVFASISDKTLYYVRCQITGMNDELVFGEVFRGPGNVQYIVPSPHDGWIIEEEDPETQCYVFNTRKNRKEKIDSFKADFVVPMTCCPGFYVVCKDVCPEYFDVQTIKVFKGQLEWIEGTEGRFREADMPLPDSETVKQYNYVALCDTLLEDSVDNEAGVLVVRVFDRNKSKPITMFSLDKDVGYVEADAKTSEYVVFITSKKCFLLSVSKIIEGGANAVTKFPINPPIDDEVRISACIVGHLLVVCHPCPKVQFICCDLNTMLTHAQQNRKIMASVWREMKIPDSIATADWIDRVYLIQEKRAETQIFFPEGHPTHSSPRDDTTQN